MKEENEAIIKAIKMYGRVPEQWELLNEIEKLNQYIKDGEENAGEIIVEQAEEIERLKNIITKLEKLLEEEIKSTKEKIKVCDDEEDRGIYLDKVYNYKDILDKLHELKGSDKE